jgi:hypothetical protein
MSLKGRLYRKGRPTKAWAKGERVRSLADVQPGDYLISVCHQFKSENLLIVTGIETRMSRTIQYRYADHRTGRQLTGAQHGPPYGMACWDFELAADDARTEFYKAIDYRSRWRRVPDRLLPWWAKYSANEFAC